MFVVKMAVQYRYAGMLSVPSTLAVKSCTAQVWGFISDITQARFVFDQGYQTWQGASSTVRAHELLLSKVRNAFYWSSCKFADQGGVSLI